MAHAYNGLYEDTRILKISFTRTKLKKAYKWSVCPFRFAASQSFAVKFGVLINLSQVSSLKILLLDEGFHPLVVGHDFYTPRGSSSGEPAASVCLDPPDAFLSGSVVSCPT